jgi:DNA-binding MarR family transcriptional regulator
MLPYDPIVEARRHWEEHGWGAAAPAMSVMTSVVRVQQVVVSRIEQGLRPFGLSMARYEVLMLLLFSRKGELPLGKLGARLQVQPGAITNAIDRLEADGHVVRRPHPSDGRTTLAKITPKGRKTVLDAVEVINEHVYEAFELPKDKIEELFELLQVVRCQAGDFPPDELDGRHSMVDA